MKRNILIINNGFSLLEITMVLIIISILLSTVIPVLSRAYLEKAANRTALDISAIQEASRKYYIDNNKWPDNSIYSTPIAALQADSYLPAAWKAINPFGFSAVTPTDYAYNISSNASSLSVCTLVVVDAQAIIQNSLTSPYVDANGNVCSTVPVPGSGVNSLGPSSSISVGTIYNATTDGLVEVVATISTLGGGTSVIGYTDSSTNPSTLKAALSVVFPASHQSDHTIPESSFSMSVKRGDYYLLTRGPIINTGATSDSANVTATFRPIRS